MNWYVYTENNPHRYIDPTGNWRQEVAPGVFIDNETGEIWEDDPQTIAPNNSGLQLPPVAPIDYATASPWPVSYHPIPGTIVDAAFMSDPLRNRSEGAYNLYIFTNDTEGSKTVFQMFELAVGEAVVNGDMVYDQKTGRYRQTNPNARFVEVNTREEFFDTMMLYYKMVYQSGEKKIDLVDFIGHGGIDQIVMNHDSIDPPAVYRSKPNYVDIDTMKEIARMGVRVDRFHLAACHTGTPQSFGKQNFAQAVSIAFEAYVEGSPSSSGGAYGNYKDILKGLPSPKQGSNNPLLINVPDPFNNKFEGWNRYFNGIHLKNPI